jgi:uncharacterized BrkB/YihY/UPF0761 family membrane protein
MALLVSFVIDKPKYGALSAPIGMMFVLYLQAIALYAVASVTAALAEVRAGGQPPELAEAGGRRRQMGRHRAEQRQYQPSERI